MAVGYSDVNGNAAVDVYDETLTLLTTLVGTGSALRRHDIPADGSTILIASGVADFVYDVASGTQLHRDFSTISITAHSIDGDGDTWGRSGFDVGAWKDNAGTYTRILDSDDPALQFEVYDACDVSADGSTFVVTGYDTFASAHFRVYCWSLSQTGATLLWTYINVGTGNLQDSGQEVSLSDDGRWIAAGSWGVEFNGHPEVLVFDRDAGNIPVA